mmetsp:Transcript_16750/g.26923  ORF Transcript_16750/g.26923 Transcript_16750/m.26923 type:complete len:260 (+) Transcript_16750:460-1239(+)
MMDSTSARPIDASARIIRPRRSLMSHGPYLGALLTATSDRVPSSPSTFSAISCAVTPSAIMSVVDGNEEMVRSSAAIVSSLAKGSTWTMYPPADRTSMPRSILTPTAIALFTCSDSWRYTAMSSAISPVVMFTMPVNGAFQSGCARLTVRIPRPTAAPTLSFPSGRSGGSALGFDTMPLTCPVLSEITVICPNGPSPLKLICTVSSSPLKVPRSSAAIMLRPSAAVAVGAVWCLDAASLTSRVPTTATTLTSWFWLMTR